VSYEKSSSYSDADADADDELDFSQSAMSSTVNGSVLQAGHGNRGMSPVLSHAGAAESDTAGASVCVCAPILVVPRSDSYISLIRAPDASPDFSPSQARRFRSLHVYLSIQWRRSRFSSKNAKLYGLKTESIIFRVCIYFYTNRQPVA